MPFRLGEDVVGVVDELGEEVSSLALGQVVAGGTFSLGGGGYTEFVCLPATDLVPVPPGVDPAEAVCVVVNYLTADLALQTAAVQRGDRVLIHGAAGVVGTALLDLGRQAGLEMYGRASRHNHQLVSAYGATPIQYRSEDALAAGRIEPVVAERIPLVQAAKAHEPLERGGHAG